MSQQRLAKLRAALLSKELDGILVSAPENRRYLSGFTGSAGYLVITQDQAIIATDFRYYEQVGQQSPHFHLVKIVQGELDTWLAPALLELKVKRLGFEANNVAFSLYEALQKMVGKMDVEKRPTLVSTYDLVEDIRILKEPEEMAIIQEAVDIADDSFTEVATKFARPGVTEREVAWQLEKGMRERGAESTSFDIIVAFGPNAALPHHRPDDQRLEKHQTVIIDMGARLHGYCSDLSRTLYLGKPDATFRKVRDLVLASQETAIATVQAGMTGADGDSQARNVIDRAGYGEQFGHGTGHGVGLLIHEAPRIGRSSTNKLSDGMVFTVEPGIYLPGWGGVRIEDIVVMERGLARDMTRSSKAEDLAGVA